MGVRDALSTYTGKKQVYLVERGNKAIKLALQYAKDRGKTKVLIPEEGGWMTYEQYPAELRMECVKIKCRNARLDLTDLKEHLGKQSVLLVNSMPAYSCYEQMELIFGVCERYGTMVINDVSGSIGKVEARYGHVMVGSFGKWKPISIEGGGGFVAAHEPLGITEAQLDEMALARAIKSRGDRIQYWEKAVQKIKSDLSDMRVVHPETNGYVAIVRYKSEAEKLKLVEYCAKHDWWYTECPRYIRIQDNAISIEVKQRGPEKI